MLVAAPGRDHPPRAALTIGASVGGFCMMVLGRMALLHLSKRKGPSVFGQDASATVEVHMSSLCAPSLLPPRTSCPIPHVTLMAVHAPSAPRAK